MTAAQPQGSTARRPLIVVYGFVKDTSELAPIKDSGRYLMRRQPRRGGRYDGEPYLQPDLFIPYTLGPSDDDELKPRDIYAVDGPAWPAMDKAGPKVCEGGRYWVLALRPTEIRLDALELISGPTGRRTPERGEPLIALARLNRSRPAGH